MKILYKPFGIISSVIGAKIANSIFRAMWTRIDKDQVPPKATTDEASFQKVVGAAALQAATTAAVGAAVDRASARTFHYLTGIWPGERRAAEQQPESNEKEQSEE
jgi:predicted phage tail protein